MPAVLPPWYYRLFVAIAAPLYRLRLWQKRRSLVDYPRQARDRFGKSAYPVPKPTQRRGRIIWCHAVSLGELNTVYPALRLLLDDGHAVFITSVTQTGFDRAATLFGRELASGQVAHGFLPVDTPCAMQAFLGRLQPRLALFVETELWANALYLLKKQGAFSVVVNARLKPRSFAGYRRFSALSNSLMANLTRVIVQDAASRDRFVQLGLDGAKATLADSLKWSQSYPPPMVDVDFGERRVWVAASTHAPEEEACLLAHEAILRRDPSALLVLAPRHPERFEEVFALCQTRGLATARRSKNDDPSGAQVYLADSLGELLAWYAKADVAFVGGSLADKGGHNPIEAAAMATPAIMGSRTQSCQHVLDDLLQAKAAVQIREAAQLAQALARFLFDKDGAKKAGEAGLRLSQSKAGAAAAQKALLDEYLA